MAAQPRLVLGRPAAVALPSETSAEQRVKGLYALDNAQRSPSTDHTKECEVSEQDLSRSRAVQAAIAGIPIRAHGKPVPGDEHGIESKAGVDAPPGSLFHRTGVHVASLPDAALPEFKPHYQYTVTGRMRKKNAPDRPKVGSNATVNGSRLALFRHGDQVFATDAACPHQGGDLAAGDIEDLDGSLCVSCPVHGFSFDLQRGGVSVVPCGTYQLRVFPTKVDAEGVLSVALPGGMHPAMFDEDF
ncbi:RFESD [Symbiodinium sp. KB8]|nr:RFESD [Symbiodinium sp. KB8]